MSVQLKDDREYSRRRGQWLRIKTPPPSPKRCFVTFRGASMQYDELNKKLVLGGKTIFSSKRKAQIAIWHTSQNDGVPDSHTDYEIELI